jgi:hypothetical protein
METSESLRRLVLEYYAAVNSHDEVALKERSALVPEASMIGTDGHEWLIGSDAVQGAFRQQFLEFGEIVFEPGDVIASAHGDAGWFVDQPTLVWGEQRIVCRCSGTAVRIDGQWLVVQTHMSMPRED